MDLPLTDKGIRLPFRRFLFLLFHPASSSFFPQLLFTAVRGNDAKLVPLRAELGLISSKISTPFPPSLPPLTLLFGLLLARIPLPWNFKPISRTVFEIGTEPIAPARKQYRIPFRRLRIRGCPWKPVLYSLLSRKSILAVVNRFRYWIPSFDV